MTQWERTNIKNVKANFLLIAVCFSEASWVEKKKIKYSSQNKKVKLIEHGVDLND